jgi:hypothetical protein
MENINEILELLEKKTLTEAETKFLEDLSESNDEVKSFIRIYKNFGNSLSASKHIHPDLIASYILNEMGDESDNKLISVLKDKIKSHLGDCTSCRDEYNVLLDEYKNISSFVDQSIAREEQTEIQLMKSAGRVPFLSSYTYKYAFTTLAILLVGYFGLFLITSSATPDYKKNIFSDSNDDFYKTRGRTSDAFQHGLYAIENDDFESAIKYLFKDIKEHSNEKSIFYSYYILGITYLRNAETDFIGLFKSFKKEDVELAIENLNHSIEKNSSGDYESLKLNSYYYLGRAYLLIDNISSAKSSLQKVVNGKGRYSKESLELIKQLKEN